MFASVTLAQSLRLVAAHSWPAVTAADSLGISRSCAGHVHFERLEYSSGFVGVLKPGDPETS